MIEKRMTFVRHPFFILYGKGAKLAPLILQSVIGWLTLIRVLSMSQSDS